MLYSTPIFFMLVKYGVKTRILSLIEFLFYKKMQLELCLSNHVEPIVIFFFKN